MFARKNIFAIPSMPRPHSVRRAQPKVCKDFADLAAVIITQFYEFFKPNSDSQKAFVNSSFAAKSIAAI